MMGERKLKRTVVSNTTMVILNHECLLWKGSVLSTRAADAFAFCFSSLTYCTCVVWKQGGCEQSSFANVVGRGRSKTMRVSIIWERRGFSMSGQRESR